MLDKARSLFRCISRINSGFLDTVTSIKKPWFQDRTLSIFFITLPHHLHGLPQEVWVINDVTYLGVLFNHSPNLRIAHHYRSHHFWKHQKNHSENVPAAVQ